jgi:hypothetical protein
MCKTSSSGFEVTSKRRKGFPSETRVKRGHRIVHGDKHLHEKLGRKDPCPCGSGKSFQALLPAQRLLLTASFATTTTASDVLRSGSSVVEQRSYKATVGIPEFPGAIKYLRP